MDPVQPAPATEPARPKLTAVEARKTYGIRLAIAGFVLSLFVYDGWFNAKYQTAEKTSDMWFNRICAFPLMLVFLYYAVMFASAARAALREPKPPPEETPAPPAPPPAPPAAS